MGDGIGLGVLFVLFIIVAGGLFFAYFSSGSGNSSDGDGSTSKRKGDFRIRNHLLLDVLLRVVDSGKIVIEKKIPTKQESSLSKREVVQYLYPGQTIEIWVHPSTQPEKATKYADYVIRHYDDERLKGLNIGMITTRWLGDGWPLNQVSHASAATGGSPWVMIHNFSQMPLELNSKIVIPPASKYKYYGGEGINGGVPLGTWFRDTSPFGKAYPEYQHLWPQSDLYYGIISDIEQPIYGPWQAVEFSEVVDEKQTMWPMQTGWL